MFAGVDGSPSTGHDLLLGYRLSTHRYCQVFSEVMCKANICGEEAGWLVRCSSVKCKAMTIVVFLIDSSASMAQKTYQGTAMLDVARSIVELFLKQRVRDAGARGDRYMLMSFEEFPANVKAGWRESQSVFQEQLKLLKPHGLTSFGAALGSALRFVNVNRLQTGIDSFGNGRYPFYIEPVAIISITDGNCLTCPFSGTVNEIKVAKPSTIGNELIEEPFRWDQRVYSLVLRLGGSAPTAKVTPGMALPADNSPIDAMCVATGGRSYCVSSHKMLPMCVESVVQKLQQVGIMLRLEKVGPDPVLSADRLNGLLENGITKRNGELNTEKHLNSDAWRSILTTVYSRAQRCYPGHWPIPEAFWPDRNMSSLPPRKAHPVILFRCEPCEPIICQDFPFDKYELEASPLTKFILNQKQSGVCWQVFVANSSPAGSSPAPFGYLKAASNLSSVNLFIMPYNYPLLLPLVEELKIDPKAKTSHSWRLRLEKYLSTMPSYYVQPLKKAFARLNYTHPMLESDQMQQYSYSVLSYIAKVKHMAREEFDSLCGTITSSLHQSIPPTVPLVNVFMEAKDGHQIMLAVFIIAGRQRYMRSIGLMKHVRLRTGTSIKCVKQHANSEIFKGFQVQTDVPKLLIAPSVQFRNPFEIKRERLLEQLSKMRTNLVQQLNSDQIPIFEGGRPGTSIKLQHAEDLHNLPISQMGNYQEYIKSLEAAGRSPLRELEPQALRIHAFGNPFKIDKKNMTVDEVGEGNLLGNSTKLEIMKKRSTSCSSSSSAADNSRPPRRKAGPLAPDSLSRWRRRRRESSSSASSTVSSNDDLDSISSLDQDSRYSGALHPQIEPSTSKFSNSEGKQNSNGGLLAVHRDMNRCSQSKDTHSPLLKKARFDHTVERLEAPLLKEKKLLMGKFVRKLLSTEKIISMLAVELDGVCVADKKVCLLYALREAKRFKRRTLTDPLMRQLSRFPNDPGDEIL